jgi:epoxyqueuosine reductase
VCPWNGGKFVQITGAADFDGRERDRERERRPEMRELPGTTLPSLMSLVSMTYEEWDEWTRGSAMRRSGYAGLKRNVAVALGNWRAAEAVPVLVGALSDPEPLVRVHAAWALSEIGSFQAVADLEARERLERDPSVRAELEAALVRSRCSGDAARQAHSGA